MDSFLDRCAEADPETAALLMAMYNEGIRTALEASGYYRDAVPWYMK